MCNMNSVYYLMYCSIEMQAIKTSLQRMPAHFPNYKPNQVGKRTNLRISQRTSQLDTASETAYKHIKD